MSLQLHRPDGKGGLEVRTGHRPRTGATSSSSSRWGASLKGGTLPELSNPEMNPTSTLRSVPFWVVLAAITFAIIVVGYTRPASSPGIGPLFHLPVRRRLTEGT